MQSSHSPQAISIRAIGVIQSRSSRTAFVSRSLEQGESLSDWAGAWARSLSSAACATGEGGDLFAAQRARATALSGVQADVVRLERLAPAPEKIGQLVSIHIARM
jgi:hypothetical protein